jgi:hypothetical protein
VWGCNGRDNQLWYWVGTELRNKHDNRCLDEDVSSPTRDGTRIQVYTCNAQDNQRWDPLALFNLHDNRCLDEDVSHPTHDGTKVQAWTCIPGAANQRW